MPIPPMPRGYFDIAEWVFQYFLLSDFKTVSTFHFIQISLKAFSCTVPVSGNSYTVVCHHVKGLHHKFEVQSTLSSKTDTVVSFGENITGNCTKNNHYYGNKNE